MRNNPNEMWNSWKHCVHPAIWVSFDNPRHGKRKETLRAASRLPLRMLQQKGNRASINIVVKMCLSLNSEIPALKCWLHQLPSRENLRHDFDPENLIEILSCVFSSPKTPAKKCSSRTRATSKDTDCLVRGICLIGERRTFISTSPLQALIPILSHVISSTCQKSAVFNPIQTRLFWSICDWGEGLLGPPPLYLWNQ